VSLDEANPRPVRSFFSQINEQSNHSITTKKSIRLFFTMKCYLLAALVLVPTMASGFGLTRWRRPMVVYSPVEALIKETEALMNRQFGELQNDFGRFSPKYEITNTDDKFELAVDVPGVKAQDVNITLENDGQVLAISGERSDKGDNYAYSTKFYQSFSLDPAIITDKFDANMKDGVLVISAPKEVKKIEAASSQKIPITAAEESKEEHVDVEVKEKEVAA
jgi:HSP20 family protein